MPINTTWLAHHQEQVEAARAEFDEMWHSEEKRMVTCGEPREKITSTYVREWHKFLTLRLPEKYPGDIA